MRLRSLRALTLAFLIVFLLVVTGTGIAIFSATHAAIVSMVDKRIASESRIVAGPRYPADRAAVLARIAEAIDNRTTGDIGFELTDAAGRHIAGNVTLSRRPPPGFSALDAHDRIAGLNEGRALVRDIGGGLVLATIAETERVHNYGSTRRRIYLAGFGAIIVLVIGALIVFVDAIRRRIRALSTTAEAIIDGDMRRRVPFDGSRNEFDDQARIFNRMLDRIGELMSGIANISNDIAHDLRTPLARLRNQLTLVRQQADSAELRAAVDEAIVQSDHLLAMFAAVLRIVEVEGGDRRAAFEPLDLGTLTAGTGRMMEPVAQESGHALIVGDCPAAPITGDRQLLTQAIINLIENALRHTPPGSTIDLSVRVDGSDVLLAVADNGPGIAADQRERALRRFGRIDRSRSRPGHGLGLPLVDAIARLHRGTLDLDDAAPGLRVTMTLPVASAK